MSEGSDITEETSGGLVQLRFDNEDHTLSDVNAAELATSLQGLVELTSQMAKAGLFGDGPPPTVRVGTPQRGSVIIEAGLLLQQYGGPVGGTMAASTSLAMAIRFLAKQIRGANVTGASEVDGMIMVTWSDTTVDFATPEQWKAFQAKPKKTKKALHKILTPLSDDVTRVEVRSSPTSAPTEPLEESEPEEVLTVQDYRDAGQTEPDEEEAPQPPAPFEITARMVNVDFRPDKKWAIEWDDGGKWKTKTVTLADGDFLTEIAAGRTVSKHDLLRLMVLEESVAHGQRVRKDWTVTKVISQRRGGGDDDGDAATA